MSNDCFSSVLASRDEFVKAAAERLLAQPLQPMNKLTPRLIPKEAGVYMIYQDSNDQPFHIGESSSLRQRIYTNQYQGTVGQSAIKRKLKKQLHLKDDELKSHIRDYMLVRFLTLPLGRIEVEDYLNKHFGIVESSPRNASGT